MKNFVVSILALGGVSMLIFSLFPVSNPEYSDSRRFFDIFLLSFLIALVLASLIVEGVRKTIQRFLPLILIFAGLPLFLLFIYIAFNLWGTNFVIATFLIIFVGFILLFPAITITNSVWRPIAMKRLARAYGLEYKKKEGTRENIVTGNIHNIPASIYDITKYRSAGRGEISSRATVVSINNKSSEYQSFVFGYCPVGKLRNILDEFNKEVDSKK
jgi:hypothetical protein